MPAYTIPAITLHQPWATLIALGIKTIETRSWPPPKTLIGQRLAIHAGRSINHNPGQAIVNALRPHYGLNWADAIPTKAVVACATLTRAQQAGPETPADPFGDFSPGRWLWFLADITPLHPPVPASGRQRIWRWTPPRREGDAMLNDDDNRCELLPCANPASAVYWNEAPDPLTGFGGVMIRLCADCHLKLAAEAPPSTLLPWPLPALPPE